MTEPIDQPTKDLIEKEAMTTGKKPTSLELQTVSKYLEKLLNEKLYKEVESLREQLETQSHDQVRIIEHLEQELVKERELRKELVSALESLNSYAPDFPEYPNGLSVFDLGLRAASQNAKSLIQKAKDKSHE